MMSDLDLVTALADGATHPNRSSSKIKLAAALALKLKELNIIVTDTAHPGVNEPITEEQASMIAIGAAPIISSGLNEIRIKRYDENPGLLVTDVGKILHDSLLADNQNGKRSINNTLQIANSADTSLLIPIILAALGVKSSGDNQISSQKINNFTDKDTHPVGLAIASLGIILVSALTFLNILLNGVDSTSGITTTAVSFLSGYFVPNGKQTDTAGIVILNLTRGCYSAAVIGFFVFTVACRNFSNEKTVQIWTMISVSAISFLLGTFFLSPIAGKGHID
jgi:hypothetical protein